MRNSFTVKKALGFALLASIASMAFMLSSLAATISGKVAVSRENTTVAAEQSLMKMSFMSGSGTAVAEVPLETSSTVGNTVSYSVTAPVGSYDVLINKSGYLPYTVKNVLINSQSEITFPDITLTAGNVNNDEKIDLADLSLLLRSFDSGESFSALRAACDINEDGVYNISDFGTIKKDGTFGATAEQNILSFTSEWDKNRFIQNEEAFYLISDLTFSNSKSGVQSGWDYNGNGASEYYGALSPSYLSDISDTYGTYFKRDFYLLESGFATFETVVSLSAANGFYISFTNSAEDNAEAVRISTMSGSFFIKTQAGNVAINKPSAAGTYVFKIELNLDTQKYTFRINGQKFGEYSFAQSVSALDRVYIGTSDNGRLNVVPSCCFLYANYSIRENFGNSDNALSEWTKTANVQRAYMDANRGGDQYSVKMTPTASTQSYLRKSFSEIGGKTCFEVYFLLPTMSNNASFSVKSGSTDALKLVTNNGKLYTASGEEIRYYTENLWHILRMELDPDTQTALIKINGKKVKTVSFDNAVSYFDSISIDFAPSASSVLWVDDITLFSMQEEPEDYCPEPIPVNDDDYIVGINVCNLWRNGHHWGWECVSAYDELTPYLGYYDEGVPELADWEIKYMVEHGIDYQAVCWYAPGTVTNPIKKTGMNEALIDGYFNAKYSDMINFNIMWENSAGNVKNMQQFKDYFVPYIMEYLFKDGRYQKVDNKPVITIWSPGQVISSFGSEAGALEALNYLRSECVKAGFDGCIILFADGHSQSASPLAQMKRIGADATYAYHWNKTGADPYHQIYRLTLQRGFDVVDIVPTVSVGFNNIAWSGERSDMLDPDNYHIVTNYIKDEFLPYYGDSYLSKMAFISTWNEYGEGTFVMPTNRYGFGYLDGVRKAFSNSPDVPHTDIVPTQNQLDRIARIYPQDRHILRPQMMSLDIEADSTYASGGILFKDYTSASSIISTSQHTTGLTIQNGCLTGTAVNDDPAVTITSKLGFSATSVPYLRLKMRATPSDTSIFTIVQVFFETSSSGGLTEGKSVRATLEISDEFTELYIYMGANSAWKDTIKTLRIDPMSCAGVFEIESLEFMSLKPAKSIFLNGHQLSFRANPKVLNGNTYVTINPSTGILFGLKAYHEWHMAQKELYLEINNHTVVFTVGSNIMLLDGESVTLPTAVTMTDGLPVIPINILIDNVGYSFTDEANQMKIYTVSAEEAEIINSRKGYEWEFGINGDLEGWNPMNCNLSVSNGILSGTAIGRSNGTYDPIISSKTLSLPAENYTALKIRMKHTCTAKDNLVLYFQRATDDAMSEARTAKVSIPASSNGAFVEYTLDLTECENWNGTIKYMRIDPFNTGGSFEIDYVRLVKSSAVTTCEILNGNASGSEMTFMSDNATVTFAADPYNPNNRVFKVTPKSGKNWTYFRQKVHFTEGARYRIQFDALVTGTNDGNTSVTNAVMYLNLRYNDGTADSDHMGNSMRLSTDMGWTSFSQEVTIENSIDRDGDEFAIYTNPIGNLSVGYMIDNVVITEIQ